MDTKMKNSPKSIESIDKVSYRWIILISVIVPVLVAVLIFMPQKLEMGQEWVYFLPHLNAVINSAATLALLLGL